MFGVWPFGFILGWRLAHAPPAVLAVGVVVGVTSFLGAHGARMLHGAGTRSRSRRLTSVAAVKHFSDDASPPGR
jgi:hypothetical protein